MICIQIFNEKWSKVIASHPPDDCDIRPLSCRRHGLVCAFATGNGQQVAAADGFAGRWKARRTHDKVCIQRADHENIIL
jgi:hypothetical protein